MSLYGELKRRNVFRVVTAYLAGAWLLIEVADTIFPYVKLGETAVRILIIVLAIGFPVTVLLNWVFELTPEGVKLEKDVDRTLPSLRTDTRWLDRAIIVLLVLALGYFAFDKWWPHGPPELSIAVLPFENLSSDPGQEYLADGISDDIRNLVAQIHPLKVIARHSSFAFKGKDVTVAEIAQQLNVRHILEGIVRRSGDRVRITAQLIDAKDSSYLWSQTFDRDYDAENLFHVQSETARAITNRLRMTLTGDDEKRLANVPTTNTEAYAAYLLGRPLLIDRKVEGLADAVEHFALAVELDPQFAGAYSGLVDACMLYKTYSGGQSHEHCPSSLAGHEQLARKAVELDPESGEAWISLGEAINLQEDSSLESLPRIREAITAFERGLELNPSTSLGYHWYAVTLIRNKLLYPDPPWGWLEAYKASVWESIYDKALEVDPLAIQLHYMKAQHPFISRSKEVAIWHGHRMVEIAPDSPRGYETLGEQAWSLHGRIDESIRWESKALEMDPQHSAFPMSMGRAYSALGDPDMALAYFDLAKTLIAPDNKPEQDGVLVEQAIIRLVSGKNDADPLAELHALLSEPRGLRFFNIGPGIFLDLAAGRPADALARIEAWFPECFEANSIEEQVFYCPRELVRVYQELGDHTAARDLADRAIAFDKRWAEVFQGDPTVPQFEIGTLASAGRTDEALDTLENEVTSGWRGYFLFLLRFTLYFDVLFDAIRDDERFQAIVATIEADMAQQLENVREMQRRGEVPTLAEVNALMASKQEN